VPPKVAPANSSTFPAISQENPKPKHQQIRRSSNDFLNLFKAA